MKAKYDVNIDLVKDWIDTLDRKSLGSLYAAIEMLERMGPRLGRLLVDTLSHSNISNLKKLRPPSSKKSEMRIIFAFDPLRNAIFLVAGDKSSGQYRWNEWYNKNITLAEHRYLEHLRSLSAQKGTK